MIFDILVVGGGAAGLMAAGCAAELGAGVCLLEKMERLGKKLSITGKGRCNVTNNCDRDVFIDSVPGNGRFLYGAFSAFSCRDTITFFESRGLRLKTERGNRVFPVSDRAQDVVDALVRYAKENGVVFHRGRAVSLLQEEGHVCGVLLEDVYKRQGCGCSLGEGRRQ